MEADFVWKGNKRQFDNFILILEEIFGKDVMLVDIIDVLKKKK